MLSVVSSCGSEEHPCRRHAHFASMEPPRLLWLKTGWPREMGSRFFPWCIQSLMSKPEALAMRDMPACESACLRASF